METATTDLYTTLDAYQAAFLALRGHRTSLKGSEKVVFYFEANEKLLGDLGDYQDGASVGALRFALAVKHMKSLIHSARKGKGQSRNGEEKEEIEL